MWDVGAGSGQLSLPLAQEGLRVVATDASAAQIARMPGHRLLHPVRARAELSPLATGSVSLVTAAQAAHWFALSEFYREVRRVGESGVRLALVGYGAPRIEPEGSPSDKALRSFHREVAGPYWPPERRLVDHGYETLPFPFSREEADPGLRMEAEWGLAQLLGYVRTWSSVRALEEARGMEPLERFRRELEAAWGDPVARRNVVWPLFLRAGRV